MSNIHRFKDEKPLDISTTFSVYYRYTKNFERSTLLKKGGKMNLWLECLQLISYIVIAGTGLYFIRKDRIAPYVSIIHSKRIEGFLEIAGTLADIHYKLKINLYPGGNLQKHPSLSKEIKHEKREKLKSLSKKWGVILPEEINSNISDFLLKYDDLIRKVNKRSEINEEEVAKIFEFVDYIYKTGQKNLGLKKLSFEIIERLQAE